MNVFKKLHNISKKLCYKIQFLKYGKDVKDTWDIIKEFLEKRKVISPFFNKIIIDNIGIKVSLLIVEKFDNSFG